MKKNIFSIFPYFCKSNLVSSLILQAKEEIMHNSLYLRPLILVFFIISLGSSKNFAQLPEDFFHETVAQFSLPVGLAFDSRGFGYVWEKAGKVWVLDSNEVKLPQPLLDISEEVGEWRDHGLLGFALDPDFLFNGYIYCLYTVDRHHLLHYGTPTYSPDSTSVNQATIGRIARFTADPSSNFTTTLPNSRKVLLGETIANAIPIPNNLHGVGSLAFGDDGSLLASTGDGGPDFQANFAGDFHIDQALEDGILKTKEHIGPFRAQLVDALSGKILRLDSNTGDGLPDNPFFDAANPRSPASRVWTLGIRNPYRMKTIPGSGSHDPGSGNPGIIVFGDVGEGQWEEINFIRESGLNCGWPIYEGLGKSIKWANDLRPNKDAPNPLSCNSDFFHFQDLLLPAREDATYFWKNPCDENQIIDSQIPQFYHHWPALEYNNQMWNQPTRARVAYFDEDGNKKVIKISEGDAPVRGDDFDGFSAMAGFWYEQGDLPQSYEYSYWVADFSGWIKVLQLNKEYRITQVDSFSNTSKGIVDLAFNPHNQGIYYVNVYSGQLHRISYNLDPPPMIVLHPDTLWGTSPLTVNFDASASYHPNNIPFDFYWDFGDGSTATVANPSHIFKANGSGPESLNVHLELTDSLGKKSEKMILVSLNNSPPDIRISSVVDGESYPISGYTSLELAAEVKDAEHADRELQYSWQTFLHHNAHFHPEPLDTNRHSYTLIDPLGCQEELYFFRVVLKVEDPQGLTSQKEVRIYPNCEATGYTLNLSVRALEQSTQLNWDLSQEKEIEKIVIQRVTAEAGNWDIGEVALNSTGLYTFEDRQAFRGINNYRLKISRTDGSYDYSNFASLIFPAPPPFVLYPNPADEEVFLQISNAQKQSMTWRLFTTDGQLQANGSIPEASTDFVLERIDISDWKTGIYLMEVTIGTEKYTKKLLVN